MREGGSSRKEVLSTRMAREIASEWPPTYINSPLTLKLLLFLTMKAQSVRHENLLLHVWILPDFDIKCSLVLVFRLESATVKGLSSKSRA